MKEISGIYAIKNRINGKVYIGMTINLHGRIQTHKSYLKYNKHVNRYLQSDYNEFGLENFEFITLEECDDNSQLEDKERMYIFKYKSTDRGFGYNLTYGGRTGYTQAQLIRKKPNRKKYTRKKIGYNKTVYKIRKPYKSVARVDLDTNEVLQVYKTVQDACKDGYTHSNVTRVCKGFGMSHKGFGWHYVD